LRAGKTTISRVHDYRGCRREAPLISLQRVRRSILPEAGDFHMATAPTTLDKPEIKPASDLEQVMEHVRAIREDFTALAATTASLAAKHAKSQGARVGRLTEGVAGKAATYRDAVEDKVKDHPLAAVGLAALAGLALASLKRR
jgi:ElaB/YqjD/DUF883 family membrane-anchored ribosome-binding protein